MAIKGLLSPWIRDIVYTRYCTALNIIGAYVMYEEYYLAHFPFYAFFCHLHLHLWCKVQSSL